MQTTSSQRRTRRRAKIKARIRGTAARPRLVVFRSRKSFSAQIVDDTKSKTLYGADARQTPNLKAGFATVAGATAFGAWFGAEAKKKGVATVVFDRAGYAYHGRVAAFADSVRKAGLIF